MMQPQLRGDKGIRIATINLLNFIAPPLAYYEQFNIYSASQWQQKCRWISDYLALHQPDIVGFQEVFSVAELRQLMAEAGYEYFAVIDEPQLLDAYIYHQPVTALASRYPIIELGTINISADARQQLGVSPDFEFSRQPLWVEVDIAGLGHCDCYVIHFKSKRPQLNATATGAINSDYSHGASALQRLGEASLLHGALAERYRRYGLPMLVMGDFNDALSSDLLAGLLTPMTGDLSAANPATISLQLHDSFQLYQQETGQSLAPIPTHYYGGQGRVLDYVLLSQDFAPHYSLQLACVEGYEVFDRHLLRPDYALDSHSTDHAAVMVSVQLRR
ncbi:endonuclease/exonuclease/phosphatase family protein [Shewanella sp. NIFS-20-20]|uniref:endonuclease/exonuclease/phosphatase family protein n=1 Tax=Shewanella sp. NIFS-20-20 TaxID=2853806 RepID=UPI001C480A16|nr:endonuclease/exonuclease/phosphatase family protein [Shewanella sp. NIFS-20-20]MBV7314711.1 endonuclease/exonuclease/phosphatase family protein [Shewanella sp. NIFS-20-20]